MSVSVFLKALLGLPHCPKTHLPCGRKRSRCPHTSETSKQRTANSRRQAAYNRWHALGGDETRKDTQDINHHHQPSSFYCDSEKCHFAASSLALPILRAPLVADASHAHYRYHCLGTWIQLKSSSPSLGTHPSPHPLSSHCVRALSTPQSGPPVLQLRFSLRALSTRYRCIYVSHPV